MLHVKKLQKCTRGTEVPFLGVIMKLITVILDSLYLNMMCFVCVDLDVTVQTFLSRVSRPERETEKPDCSCRSPDSEWVSPIKQTPCNRDILPSDRTDKVQVFSHVLPAAQESFKAFLPQDGVMWHRQDFLQEHSVRKRVTVDSSRCWACWENSLPAGTSNNPHWPGGRKWRIKEV